MKVERIQKTAYRRQKERQKARSTIFYILYSSKFWLLYSIFLHYSVNLKCIKSPIISGNGNNLYS